MNNERFHIIVESFVKEFNKMCKAERKDLLIRERMVEYEYNSELKRYSVKYIVRKWRSTWRIEAVGRGFWIFRARFPLIKIKKSDHFVTVTGLYSQSISKFDVNLIDQKLKEYLLICKRLPRDVFIRS